MKKPGVLFRILLCMMMLLLLSGCWGVRELNALSLVLGIGIDVKPEQPDKVFMTAQIVKPGELKKSSSGGDGQGMQTKAYWNLQSSGETIFDAIREYTHDTNNKLYIAHNEVIIFGKDAAASGVQKYLDFFMRAQETRPTTQIVVSTSTAADVLDVMPELDKLPAVNAAKLVKAQGFTSQSEEVTLQDFINFLLSKTDCAVAPMVMVTDNGGKKTLAVRGLAVFKEDRMVGELTDSEARGLMWVNGLVKTGVIDVPYLSGIASFEIKKATSTVKPEIRDGIIIMKIDIKEEGSMVAQTCIQNLETVAEMSILENMEQASIQREIQATVDKAKQMNTDIFGFGEIIHKSNNADWHQMESQWDKIFPAIQVEINVKCKIRSAGNITKPALPK